MKIAILLGIAKYQNPVDNLPACDVDLDLMDHLLHATGEYQDIVTVSGNDRKAGDVKNEMSEWFAKYVGQPIDEVFFYYTGHGMFADGEFHFPLYDYEETRLRQTSLSNSELDSWLRSLHSELTVKVIDACHSGISYIKGGNETISKLFEDSKSGFQKCIFMFSSTVEQASFQDSQLSFFTKAFIDAVKGSETPQIRFRQIMDAIADSLSAYSGSIRQTPVFVTQVNNTEVFSSITAELRSLSYSVLESASIPQETSDRGMLGLKEFVAEDEKSYVSRDEALEILNEWLTKVENHTYSEELEAIYQLEVSTVTSKRIYDERIIGEWLRDNQHAYFAETETELVAKRSDFEPARIMAALSEHYLVREIVGFKHTDEFPYKAIYVTARRLHKNLPLFTCTLTYLPRRNSLLVFRQFIGWKDKNWNDFARLTTGDWKSLECAFGIREELWKITEEILYDFEHYILENVKAIFGFTDQ